MSYVVKQAAAGFGATAGEILAANQSACVTFGGTLSGDPTNGYRCNYASAQAWMPPYTDGGGVLQDGRWLTGADLENARRGACNGGGGTFSGNVCTYPGARQTCLYYGGKWNASTLTCTPYADLVQQQKDCAAAGGAWNASDGTCDTRPADCSRSGGSWDAVQKQCSVTPGQPTPKPVTPKPINPIPGQLPPAPPAPSKSGLSALSWAAIIGGGGAAAIMMFGGKDDPLAKHRGTVMKPNGRRRRRSR